MREMMVITLGPGDAQLLTRAAEQALRQAPFLVLRTSRHGVAHALAESGIAFETLDALYDSAEDFDVLNAQSVSRLMTWAIEKDGVCYGVADATTDATVQALRAPCAEAGIRLVVLPGVTQAAQIACEALEAPAQSLSYHADTCVMPAGDFDTDALFPARPLLLTEVHSRLLASELKLQLLALYPADFSLLYRRMGDARVITLENLDRQSGYDHTSACYLPAIDLQARDRYTFGDLVTIMAQLRAPNGCPWDREQTHETLRQYLIEEAYEAVDAIDQGDRHRLADELGDVLLQVVFHACVGSQQGTFDILDVTSAICHKMITRHAHIFGDVHCETSADVLKSWELIKKKEKGLRSQTAVMEDVPRNLPALMRAAKVQNKAKQVGFDWDHAEEALKKVDEEAREVAQELSCHTDPTMELGDLLFAVVNVARLAGVQPELALSQATEKFIHRFQGMEQAIVAEGKQLRGMTLAEMDVYWNRVKAQEAE